jgi:4-oxalocrotonate tautomerase
MPLVRISLRQGKSDEYKRAIGDGVYQALRETFTVPEEDIARTDDLVILQITVSNTRTIEQKKALFARIVELLSQKPGLRKEDIFINLLEVAKENWSFGNGVAQYA